MGGLAVRRLGGWCLIAAAFLAAQPLNRLTAQVVPNRANAYLFPTDVSDARAISVNPAGLGVQREASVYAELAVGDPGAKGRLRQINAGFNSRGLSFGYQRDLFDNGLRGSTIRLGLAGGSGGLAVGFAVARYGGSGANETGWDLGMSYVAHPGLTVGVVAANLGQPIVRGVRQRLTFVPGATWHPNPVPVLAVSAAARITPDSVGSYAFGLRWRTPATGRRPIEILLRLDTDRDLGRAAFAVGLSIGGQNRIGAVATTPGDVSSIDGASLYGLATRLPGPRGH
ncbi:MAG TPA: hypothetical protein VGJ80_09475 [Gemmatimonadales bacterium]|jgi:hypothetical protein